MLWLKVYSVQRQPDVVFKVFGCDFQTIWGTYVEIGFSLSIQMKKTLRFLL